MVSEERTNEVRTLLARLRGRVQGQPDIASLLDACGRSEATDGSGESGVGHA